MHYRRHISLVACFFNDHVEMLHTSVCETAAYIQRLHGPCSLPSDLQPIPDATDGLDQVGSVKSKAAFA
jgi:hypothetical protein